MEEKEIAREEFGTLLLSSFYNIENVNKKLQELGVTIKPYTGYEYYYGDNFICSSEDFCLDDILDKLNIKVID